MRARLYCMSIFRLGGGAGGGAPALSLSGASIAQTGRSIEDLSSLGRELVLLCNQR